MKPPRHRFIIIVSILICVGIWAAMGIYLPPTFAVDATTRGQWGDQFGAANALFSSLAFAGVIYTLFLQIREHAEEAKARNASSFAEAQNLNIQSTNAKLAALSALLSSFEAEIASIEEANRHTGAHRHRTPTASQEMMRTQIRQDIMDILNEFD